MLEDLSRAESYSRVNRHEHEHFEHARNDLIRFQDRWRGGRFDRGRLDSAMGNISHLATADRVPPRAREVLSRDLYDLRDFRDGQRGDNRGYRY